MINKLTNFYRLIRLPIKLLAFLTNIMLYFITATPLAIIVEKSPYKFRKILSKIVQFYSVQVCRIFNIKIKLTGHTLYLKSNINYFQVANHLSYLDIFIFSSVAPASFVTSIEMKNTPLLGHAAQAAASLYTERRNRDNLQKEIQQVTDGLKNNLNVFVFPEATSTNGENVIMFRKSMFNAPIFAGVEILPMTINYRKLNGKNISLENRDLAFWYGDMTFAPHFLKFLMQDRLEIEIHVHKPVKAEPHHDPADLANHLHSIVSSNYDKIT